MKALLGGEINTTNLQRQINAHLFNNKVLTQKLLLWKMF